MNTIKDLPEFISFNARESCFKDTTVLNMSGLPRLASFIAGDWTFHKLKSLTLAGMIKTLVSYSRFTFFFYFYVW